MIARGNVVHPKTPQSALYLGTGANERVGRLVFPLHRCNLAHQNGASSARDIRMVRRDCGYSCGNRMKREPVDRNAAQKEDVCYFAFGSCGDGWDTNLEAAGSRRFGGEQHLSCVM